MSDVNVMRALADCDGRAGEPLGKAMRSAADEIERLQAELREARDIMRRVQSLNNAIRNDEGYHWAHASVIDGELSAFLAK